MLSVSSTALVFSPAVCTQTTEPSGETRSMYGLLPAGNSTVFTMRRETRSILETVSWSRSGVKPNRPSGVKCRSHGNLPVLISSFTSPVPRSSTAM